MKHTRFLYVLVAVALAVAVLGIVLPRPEATGDLMTFGGRPQRFGYIVADKLRVANDAEIVGTAQVDTINEQSSGSGVTIDGLTIKDGGLGIDGLISIDGGLDLSDVQITDTQTITPLASTVYVINSTGAATITMTACSETGQVVYLYGADDNTITIPDSNVRTDDGGAETFGQYDIRGWMCVGAEWILTIVADNS